MFKKKPGTEKGTKDSGSKKSPAKKTLLVITVLFLITAGGGAIWFFLSSKTPEIIENSTLPPEILYFTYQRLPDAYLVLAKLSQEITLTENEMARITLIGDNYPDQKKIADIENRAWAGNLSTLKKGLDDVEKEIRVFYVTYQVNSATGKTLIDEKKDALKQTMESLVTGSKTMTDKLREREAGKSFFQRTRERYLK